MFDGKNAIDVAVDAGICGESKNHRNFPLYFIISFFFLSLLSVNPLKEMKACCCEKSMQFAFSV